MPGVLVPASSTEDAITAKYEGGAAGMYVTRTLRLGGQVVDQYSPGFFGRFTAKAALTAVFGGPPDDSVPVLVRVRNTIRGAITEFKDGDRNLDFKVTLDPLTVVAGDAIINGVGMASVKYGKTATSDAGTGMGDWSVRLFGTYVYGPDGTTRIEEATHIPSGVSGKFDVTSVPGTLYNTRVVAHSRRKINK